MQSILANIRGVINVLWLAIATILLSVCIILIYVISLIFPRKLREKVLSFLSASPKCWVWINSPVLNALGAKKWVTHFPENLDPNGIYLVMANHQSWADILVLTVAVNKKIAPLKFFMKKELKWQLPIIGLACMAVGFPFLSRHTKSAIKKNPALKNKDKESTIKACEYVKKYPASLIIFPEGSRFTKQKHAQQHSPYKHLLKPKAGGAAMTINAVDKALQGVLDITVNFHAPNQTTSFWDFLKGAYKNIQVNAEWFPISEELKGDYEHNKEYRKVIQSWLSQRWEVKDAALTKEMKHG